MKGSNFPNKSISVAIISILALLVINNVYSPNNINHSANPVNYNNTNNSYVGYENTRSEVRQKKLVLFDLEFEKGKKMSTKKKNFKFLNFFTLFFLCKKGNLFEKFTNPNTFSTPFSKYIKSVTAGEKDLSFSHEYIYSFEGVPQLANNLFQNLSKLPKKSERGNPLFVFPVLSFACNKEGTVDVGEIEEMNGASTQTKELMCTDISK